MKGTFYNLYIGKTNGILKNENGEECDVVYCLEEDKKISDELEQNPNLKYFIIVLQKTKSGFKKWNANCEIGME